MSRGAQKESNSGKATGKMRGAAQASALQAERPAHSKYSSIDRLESICGMLKRDEKRVWPSEAGGSWRRGNQDGLSRCRLHRPPCRMHLCTVRHTAGLFRPTRPFKDGMQITCDIPPGIRCHPCYSASNVAGSGRAAILTISKRPLLK